MHLFKAKYKQVCIGDIVFVPKLTFDEELRHSKQQYYLVVVLKGLVYAYDSIGKYFSYRRLIDEHCFYRNILYPHELNCYVWHKAIPDIGSVITKDLFDKLDHILQVYKTKKDQAIYNKQVQKNRRKIFYHINPDIAYTFLRELFYTMFYHTEWRSGLSLCKGLLRLQGNPLTFRHIDSGLEFQFGRRYFIIRYNTKKFRIRRSLIAEPKYSKIRPTTYWLRLTNDVRQFLRQLEGG